MHPDAYAYRAAGRLSRRLPEHACEMLRIVKATLVSYLADSSVRGQQVLRKIDDKTTYKTAGRIAGYFFDHITQIVWRHTQPCGQILDARHAPRVLHPRVIIALQFRFETSQRVIVLTAHTPAVVSSRPVVKPLTKIENQLNVSHYDPPLIPVRRRGQLPLKQPHQTDKRLVFLNRHA